MKMEDGRLYKLLSSWSMAGYAVGVAVSDTGSIHGSCPWADAGVVIPWNVYLHYGSKTLLEECYPGMKAWVACERAREEAVGGPHLIKEGFHFADWLALDNAEPGPFGATDPLYIAGACYYKGAKCVAEAAKCLFVRKRNSCWMGRDRYWRPADILLSDDFLWLTTLEILFSGLQKLPHMASARAGNRILYGCWNQAV